MTAHLAQTILMRYDWGVVYTGRWKHFPLKFATFLYQNDIKTSKKEFLGDTTPPLLSQTVNEPLSCVHANLNVETFDAQYEQTLNSSLQFIRQNHNSQQLQCGPASDMRAISRKSFHFIILPSQ